MYFVSSTLLIVYPAHHLSFIQHSRLLEPPYADTYYTTSRKIAGIFKIPHVLVPVLDFSGRIRMEESWPGDRWWRVNTKFSHKGQISILTINGNTRHHLSPAWKNRFIRPCQRPLVHGVLITKNHCYAWLFWRMRSEVTSFGGCGNSESFQLDGTEAQFAVK